MSIEYYYRKCNYEIMGDSDIILNPILNFISRSMIDGIKVETIIAKSTSFFSHETILKAKEVLHQVLEIGTRLIRCQKDDENVLDICKWLSTASKEKRKIPKFVIYSPCEIPTIGDAIVATLTCRMNELSRKIDSLSELNKQHFAVQATSAWPSSAQSSCAKDQSNPPTYAVVLKNCPSNLSSPLLRKDFIDKICPEAANDISEVKRSSSEWKIVVKSKPAASSIADQMKKFQPGLLASVKSPAFIGVIKGVPTEMNEKDLEKIIPKCVKALQCGKSRVYKIYFEQRSDLDSFLKNSVKVGYEKLTVQNFIFIPRRCFRCHQQGHFAADCKNAELCSRCGSSEHSSTRDNPCVRNMFCITCKEFNHTCYSIKCPGNAQTDKRAAK